MLKKYKPFRYFSYLFWRTKRISLLEEENKVLEKAADAMKDTVVDSMTLVAEYKRAMMVMREYMHAMENALSEASRNPDPSLFDEPSEEEEEGEFDPYELLRKKPSIH